MDWKPARYAREAGISEVATRRLFEDDWAPTSTTIRALEALIPDRWQAGDAAPRKDAAA
jgi:hypothetical protein